MLINISYIISIIIEIGIPLILASYMWKKYKILWRIFFLGLLLFEKKEEKRDLTDLIESDLNVFAAADQLPEIGIVVCA